MATNSATMSSTSSSGATANNDSDTTYPSVVVDGSLDGKSSDESEVSLWQEHLVVHNEMRSTAETLVIPGVTSATAK
jgi:hypothetical protein